MIVVELVDPRVETRNGTLDGNVSLRYRYDKRVSVSTRADRNVAVEYLLLGYIFADENLYAYADGSLSLLSYLRAYRIVAERAIVFYLFHRSG